VDAEQTPRISTILVGVDGSPESDRAAAFATELAIQLDAEIVAAHAVGLLDVWPEHPEAGDHHNSHKHVTALMEGPWTEAFRRMGIRPRVVLLDGPPARVLLELADQIDADLIVVGSRGIGQAELFALGDTSTKLTHQSTRPVLIVPAPRPPGDTPPVNIAPAGFAPEEP
jgi:nucleotide-binding universal stress UspA family protein